MGILCARKGAKMAPKRDKPALYELMNKSSMATPAWFYGTRKADKSGSPATENAGQNAKKPSPAVAEGDGISVKRLAESCLRLTVPYWVVALAVLALILALLIAFRMGQKQLLGSAPEPAGSQNDYARTEPQRRNETKPAVIEPERSPARTPAGEKPDTAGVGSPAAVIGQIDTGTTAAAADAGQCLVLCGDSNRDNLVLVQKYFSDNGLNTFIGRFQGRYVLATQQKFDSSKSADAIALKNRIETLGENYNEKRPAGAPIFTPKTFRQAYPVPAGSIE
jgi:hypothetical protein